MNNENKILEKLEEHDQQFTKIDSKLEEHDKRFDTHDKKLDRIEQIVERLSINSANHEERLNQTATKEDVFNSQDRILRGQDMIITEIKKLNQEKIFTHQWIKRIEKDVKNHSKRITKLEKKTKIA